MPNPLMEEQEDLLMEDDVLQSEEQFFDNHSDLDPEKKNIATGMKLGISNMTSPETATTWADLSKKMDLPVDFVKRLDNTKLRQTPETKGLSDFLKDHILNSDPNDVAQFADDLEAVDNVYKALSEEADPEPFRMMDATKWLMDRGYSWSENLGSYTKNGLATDVEMDPYEGFGEEERKFLKGVNESLTKGLGLGNVLYGSTEVSERAKKRALSMMNEALENEIAVSNTLTMYYGAGWKDWSKETLDRKIKELGEMYGIQFPEVRLENIMEGGLEEVDYSRMFNLFGVIDIAEAVQLANTPNAYDLVNIGEESSVADLVRKHQVLARLAKEQRGLTLGASVVQGILEALPYMAEFIITAGVGAPAAFAEKAGVKAGTKVARNLVLRHILEEGGFRGFTSGVKALGTKQGYKALGRAIGTTLKWEAEKLPLYIPKAMAEGTKEYVDAAEPLYYVDKEGLKHEVPDKVLDEFESIFLTGFAKSMLRTYTANVSEWSGEFMPGIHILPKGLRKKLFGHFMESAGGVQRLYLRQSLMDGLPLSDWPVEFMEEYVNNAYDWVSTEIAKQYGVDWMNLDMPGVFNGWKEFVQIGTVTAGLSGGGKVVRIAQNLNEVHKVTQWLDAHNKVLEAIRNTKLNDRSSDQADRVITQPAIAAALSTVGGDRMLSFDAEGVEALYQSSPEARDFLEKVGVDQEFLSKAKDRTSLIALPESALLQLEANEKPAETTPDGKKSMTIGERLLGNLVVGAGFKLDELRKMSLGDDVVTAIKEFETRQEEYRRIAYESVQKVVTLAKIGEEETQSFVEVLSACLATLSFHVTPEEVDKVIKNLVFVFSGKPGEIEDLSDEAKAVLDNFGLLNLLANKESKEERMRAAAKKKADKEKRDRERKINRDISAEVDTFRTGLLFGLDKDAGIEHGSKTDGTVVDDTEDAKKEQEIKDAQAYVLNYFGDKNQKTYKAWFGEGGTESKAGIISQSIDKAESKMIQMDIPIGDTVSMAYRALAYAIRKHIEKGGVEKGSDLRKLYNMKFTGLVSDYYREMKRKQAFQDNGSETFTNRNFEEETASAEERIEDTNLRGKPGEEDEYVKAGIGLNDAKEAIKIPGTNVEMVPYNIILKKYIKRLSRLANPLYADLFPEVFLRYVQVLRGERSITGKKGEKKAIMTTTEAANLMKPIRDAVEKAMKPIKAAKAELKKMTTDVKTAEKEMNKAIKALDKKPEDEKLRAAEVKAEENYKKLDKAKKDKEDEISSMEDEVRKDYGSWVDNLVSTDRKNMKEVIDGLSAQAEEALRELVALAVKDNETKNELDQTIPLNRIERVKVESEDLVDDIMEDLKKAAQKYANGENGISRAAIARDYGWLYNRGNWEYFDKMRSPLFIKNPEKQQKFFFFIDIKLKEEDDIINKVSYIFDCDKLDDRMARSFADDLGLKDYYTISELKTRALEKLIQTFEQEMPQIQYYHRKGGSTNDYDFYVAHDRAAVIYGKHLAAYKFAKAVALGKDPFVEGDVETTLFSIYGLYPNKNSRLFFRAYPELANMPIVFKKNTDKANQDKGGYFHRQRFNSYGVVYEGSDMRYQLENGNRGYYLSRINQTLWHESQHAMDAADGLPVGASYDIIIAWAKNNPDDRRVKAWYPKEKKPTQKALNDFFKKAYLITEGEIHANFSGDLGLFYGVPEENRELLMSNTLGDNNPDIKEYGTIKFTAEEVDKWLGFNPVKPDELFAREDDLHRDLHGAELFQTIRKVRQSITSAGTSINSNKLPVVFSLVHFQTGTTNLDIGGGRFDNATEFLAGQGVRNLIFDPYNRSSENNRAIYEEVRSGGVDTVTVSNVLNVIKEKESRANVIRQASRALKPGGRAYFVTYEGNGSGVGAPPKTKPDQWQENRKTKDYVEEIQEHFQNVALKGKVIMAWNPINDGIESQWLMEIDGDPELFQMVFEDDMAKHPTAVPEAMDNLGEAKRLFESGTENTEVFDRTGWQKYHGKLVYRVENSRSIFDYDPDTLHSMLERIERKYDYISIDLPFSIARGHLGRAEYIYANNYLGLHLPEFVINANGISFDDAKNLLKEREDELLGAQSFLRLLIKPGIVTSLKGARLTDFFIDKGDLVALFPEIKDITLTIEPAFHESIDTGSFDPVSNELTLVLDASDKKLTGAEDTMNHEISHALNSKTINGANRLIVEAWATMHPDDPRASLPSAVIYQLFLGELVARFSEKEKKDPSLYETMEAKYIEELRQREGLSDSVDLTPIVMSAEEVKDMLKQYFMLLSERARLQKEAEEREKLEEEKREREREEKFQLRRKLMKLKDDYEKLSEARKQYEKEHHIQKRGTLPHLIPMDEWNQLHEKNLKEQARRDSLSEIERLREDVKYYEERVAYQQKRLEEMGAPLPELLQGKKGNVRGSYVKMEDYRQANAKAKFSESYAAIIRIMRGNADASTLFHETAHHLHMCVEAMVQMGIADSWLTEQAKNVDAWLDEKMAVILKEHPDMNEAAVSRMKRELLATAFEMYMMEGHTKNPKLRHAFGIMRRMMYGIYQGELLNIGTHPELLAFDLDGDRKLDPEIKTIFDGFLATEEILDKQDFVREWADALKESFGTLLSGNMKELEGMRRMFQLAESDVENKVGEIKDKAIKKLVPVWRKEAINEYKARRDVMVAQSIRDKGGLSTREIISFTKDGGDTAVALYVKGIAKMRDAKVDARIAAEENGYGSVEEMLAELVNVPDAAGFVADAIRARKEEYHKGFQDTQSAMTVRSVRNALDYAIDVLESRLDKKRTKEERNRDRRVAEAGDELLAKKAIGEMKVRDIERDKTFETSIRYDGTAFVTAFQKGDYALALDKLLSIRKTLKIMEYLSNAKDDISRVRTMLRAAPRRKRGFWMDGTYQDALHELSYYFKFSTAKLRDSSKNYRKLALENTKDEGLDNINHEFPDFLFATTQTDYRDMTFGEYKTLTDMADKLYAEGKKRLKSDMESWVNKIAKDLENCLANLDKQKAKFTDLDSVDKTAMERLRANTAKIFGWGYKLQIFLAKADNFNTKTGANFKIYESIQEAYANVVILEELINKPVNDAIKKLYESLKKTALPALPFEGDVALRAYKKWTPEMVLCLCLNMGTELNQKRIRDGFGWKDEQISSVASLLTEADWKNIQIIWDALATLGEAVGTTFREQNHYDLRMETARPFTVKTKDGKFINVAGGYYPIRYKYAKSRLSDVDSKFDKTNSLMADFSATHLRSQIGLGTPLNLSLNVLIRHIHEAAVYAKTRGVMKDAFAVVMNERYKNAYGKTQSFEQYQEMLGIMGNIANPNRSADELTRDLEKWAKGVMASTALMMNMRSVMMQLTSGTVGADELGKYYADAVLHFMANPVGTIMDVREKSQFMRNRVAYQDSDIRPLLNKFSQTNLQKVRENFASLGYLAMRSTDTLVSSVSWYGKYQQIYDKSIAQGLDERKANIKAVAMADDFVARTQGGNRAIDMTPIQLSKIGSLFAVFFSAVNAQYNTAVMTFGRMVHGDATAGESFAGIVSNCLVPTLLTSVLAFVWAGGISGYGEGDDDKIQKAWQNFLHELMASPFSGMPVIRDLIDVGSDKAADLMVGLKPSLLGTEFLNAGMISAVNDIFQNATQSGVEAYEGNWSRAAWEMADAVGAALEMPAISIYEKIYRFAGNQSNALGESLYTPPTKEKKK